MRIGYKLFAEGYPPKELVRQAVAAEEAGFDFVEISDHFHPWLYDHGHSAFAWSVLAAIAARTERIGLATGVTCPSIRYHPAIVAQAAATTAVLSDGRFMLGVGAGEQLNEHIVGRGWPAVTERHEMLPRGARDHPPALVGRLSVLRGQAPEARGRAHLRPARVAAPDRGRDRRAAAARGSPRSSATRSSPPIRIPVSSTPTSAPAGRGRSTPRSRSPGPRTSEAAASRRTRCSGSGCSGWKVLAELPNPVNFEAAAEFIDVDDVREVFACGPDADRHLEVAKEFAEAGFDHLALVNAGPDPDGFFEFFAGRARRAAARAGLARPSRPGPASSAIRRVTARAKTSVSAPR